MPVLLAYASVSTDSVQAFAFEPDDSHVVEVPDFVPAAELRAVRAAGSVDGCPVLMGRLRAYASSCRLLQPDVSHAHLVYLTTSYAVALGLPFRTAPHMVAQVLALPGASSDRDSADELARVMQQDLPSVVPSDTVHAGMDSPD